MADETIVVSRPAGGGGFGMGINRDVITKLTPNGPAAKSGLRLGDRIVTINGEDAAGLTHLEMTNRVKKSGDTLTLAVVHKGEAALAALQSTGPASSPSAARRRVHATVASSGGDASSSKPKSPSPTRRHAPATVGAVSLPPPKRSAPKTKEEGDAPSTDTNHPPAAMSSTPPPPPPPAVLAEEEQTDANTASPPPLPPPASVDAQDSGNPNAGAASPPPPPPHQADKVTDGSDLPAPRPSAKSPSSRSPAGSSRPAGVSSPPPIVNKSPGRSSPLQTALESALGRKGSKQTTGNWSTTNDADEAIRQATSALSVTTVRQQGPSCAKCRKEITENFIESQGKMYHVQCFACVGCGAPLASAPHTIEDAGPTCRACWSKANGLTCFGCKQPIVPDANGHALYTEAGGKTFHKDCFKCQRCGAVFGGSVPGPYRVNEEFLCKTHAMEAKKAAAGPRGAVRGGNRLNGAPDSGADNIVKSSRSGWRGPDDKKF